MVRDVQMVGEGACFNIGAIGGMDQAMFNVARQDGQKRKANSMLHRGLTPMKKRAAGLFFTLAIPLVSGCLPAEDAKTDGAELFEIAADTVPCVGVAPMQCLVVNGTLFYDPIEGYTHVEGKAAKIYVEKTLREGPVPADVGMYHYRRVAE